MLAAMRHRPQIPGGSRHAVFHFFALGISRSGHFFPAFTPVFGALQFNAPVAMVPASPPRAIARVGISDGNGYAFK